MGKGGQSPVERGHRSVRLKPRAFKIGSTPRNTSTRAHCAPRPHRAHNSLTRRGGRLLACCSLAFSRRVRIRGGCPRRPGGAAQGGQRAALARPLQARRRPPPRPRAAQPARPLFPPANSPVPGRSHTPISPQKARATL